jgi:hypothetical protein
LDFFPLSGLKKEMDERFELKEIDKKTKNEREHKKTKTKVKDR